MPSSVRNPPLQEVLVVAAKQVEAHLEREWCANFCVFYDIPEDGGQTPCCRESPVAARRARGHAPAQA
eukprot:527002-Alexandrium_andersonii.AAC.1